MCIQCEQQQEQSQYDHADAQRLHQAKYDALLAAQEFERLFAFVDKVSAMQIDLSTEALRLSKLRDPLPQLYAFVKAVANGTDMELSEEAEILLLTDD